MTTGRHEVVGIDSIKMENPYLRLGTDVSTLETSIKTIGLISPLIINDDDILLAGARRWQALKNLGHTEIPVIRVAKNHLQQELISIDENLVRKSLAAPEIEKQLRRAKEIYCEMAMNDEEFKNEIIVKRQKRIEESPEEEKSDIDENDFEQVAAEEFANDVSLKSGLSRNQVMKAIERDEKASESLKEARERGEINVSQANEIIRLDESDQEQILPHVSGRTVGELRKLVKEAKSVGVEKALNSQQSNPHAREFNEILKTLKKSYKIAEALELEGIEFQGPIRNDIERHWTGLKEKMDALLGDNFQVFTPDYMTEGENTQSLS